MTTDLIHDRGRGPELVGTRITVYNLLPHFLDPTATEAFLCNTYELTPEQVAAARAHILCNLDTVLAEHLKIEERMAAGNPPEVIEQAKQIHATFLRFKEWLAARQKATREGDMLDVPSESGATGSRSLPTFHDWLAQQEAGSAEGA